MDCTNEPYRCHCPICTGNRLVRIEQKLDALLSKGTDGRCPTMLALSTGVEQCGGKVGHAGACGVVRGD